MKAQVIEPVVLLVIMVSVVATVADARDDFESWPKISIKKKITDKLYFKSEPKLKYKDDSSDFLYWEIVNGFGYNAHKNLELGIYHLYADEKDASTGKWTDENRGRLEATLKTTWEGLKLSNRNRYEYRVVGAKPKSRYRTRVKIEYPTELFGEKISLYVSNEFFYDFRADAYNQNRAAVGFTRKLSEKITLDTQYIYRADKGSNDWKGRHVLEPAIKYSF